MKKAHLNRRQMDIAYADVGTGDALLFLHAFPFDREMWQPQIEALADSYRLIAPDYPGFGQSSLRLESFTIETLADIMVEFLDAIGVSGRAIVVGLSMGGYVAMAIAARHPKRLRGLVLADTKAPADDEAAKAGRDSMGTLAREQGSTAVIEKLIPKLLSDSTRSKNPEVVEQVRRMGLRQRPEAIASALVALRDRPDATPTLNEISVPTLILVGADDLITPPIAAKFLAQRIEGSKLTTISEAGHLSNLEDPVAFNSEIRNFVRQVSR